MIGSIIPKLSPWKEGMPLTALLVSKAAKILFNTTKIEKTCLALMFAIKKLRHYLQAHSVRLISRADPLKYIISRPILSGRLAKWALLLQEFEIVYVSQKSIKISRGKH
jgi:hypothetical protein